jgi:hypothetical protein
VPKLGRGSSLKTPTNLLSGLLSLMALLRLACWTFASLTGKMTSYWKRFPCYFFRVAAGINTIGHKRHQVCVRKPDGALGPESVGELSRFSRPGENERNNSEDQRNAWGLLIRPVPSTDKFMRVGIFRMASETEGLSQFQQQVDECVTII